MPETDETISTQPEGEQQPGEVHPDIEETSPPEVMPESPGIENGPPEIKGKSRFRRGFYGLLIFLMIVALGAGSGGLIAMNERVQYEEEVVGTAIADQFVRGLVDMDNGNYEIAIERFKYILTYDPDHTGARDQLTKALLLVGSTGGNLTTAIPTVKLTPTPDFRNEEELYNQALAYRNVQDWDNLIATLDALRKADSNYMAVEVDGLYYLAYRNRGVQRIRVEGNLEGGIFDIDRAELFGPIDIEASNFRQWAEWYITGVSFWDLDWEQAVQYFNMVAPAAPNLSDSSFFTASARLATAQVNYGAYLIDRARLMFSNRNYCDSYDLFSSAQQYVLLNANNQEKYQQAKWECFGYPPTATPDTGGATPTP
jgi:tetratricopeptide (TPR) repeat protein